MSVNQDLFVFALALGISGFIAYKTFLWVLYEEIGTGSAALFLGFAVVVFFAMNNYNSMNRFMTHRESRAAGQQALELVNEELQKQMETTRLLAETVEGVAESARELAVEAHRKGQVALEAARKSHLNSREIHSVTAWAAWELLVGEFLELEGYLRRWEEKNGLTRGPKTACSLADLARRLEPLSDALPETIKSLYLDRQRKYEILKKLKESSELSSSHIDETVFDLPAPPGLPVPVALYQKSGKPEGAQE
ncbi:MAG: hypothetical protein JW836_11185 [Deltaproteobacteria bacterium]|nr:hypothetical protein [Deltaproteobacteria bacterium]